MHSALAEYLRGLEPVARERIHWEFLEAEVASYITDREPPVALVSSVRAIVRRAGAILVFDDEHGVPHVLPGGRREHDETLRAALERELAEEIGPLIVGEPRRLGAMHFHNLLPRPAGSRYPYPDFLQAVFDVEASGEPVAPGNDPMVRAPRFVPVGATAAMPLSVLERAFVPLS